MFLIGLSNAASAFNVRSETCAMDFTFDLSNVALADSGSCELRQEQDVNTDEWVNICALVTFT